MTANAKRLLTAFFIWLLMAGLFQPELATAVGTYVASVDGTGYDSLEKACDAAKKNAGTVVLLRDINMDRSYLTISSTVTVDLNGYSISAMSGGFVFYINSGDLTLKSGNGKGYINGGGYSYGIIWNRNGKLTVEDGVVLQNNHMTNGYGGAVYNTGTFIMNGGTIQNTSNYSGGAIYNNGGTFEMTGGTIQNTSATYYGGAVCNGESGQIKMSNGLISNCTAAYGGGGVHLESGSFTMSGGTIEECKVTGSVHYWGDEDSSSNGGGGVSIRSSASFTMTDGLIWKNKSYGGDGGGGVANDGSFAMSGGQIIMNDATNAGGYSDDGGGVNNNVGMMTMSGGIIAKNVGMGGVCSGTPASKLTITGGAVFENSALDSPAAALPEKSKKTDIVLNTDHQTNNYVSVCAASEMSTDGYTFTAWEYLGTGWSFASPYVGTALAGKIPPESSEIEFDKANTHAFFRAVYTSPEIEEKEGIYLDGVLGDDNRDGTSVSNAVRTFEKAWALANAALLDTGKEAVTIYICGKVQVSDEETWGDNSSKSIVVMRSDGYQGVLAEVAANGKLTLQNIIIDGNKTAEYTDSLIHVKGGELLIKDGTILQNNFAGRTEKGYDGGAVYIESGSGEMTGGQIQNNTARNNGGGVSVCYGSFTISGGSIVKNTAKYGGGICAVRGGHIEISNNALISDNTAYYGGGINLGAYTSSEAYYGTEHKQQTLTMSGGTIAKNSAGANGGGIFIQTNSTAIVTQGNITENKTLRIGNHSYCGGGIYVNGGKGIYLYGAEIPEEIPNGRLELYNVEIANNSAGGYGGALAACPTANVKIYVAEGAVLYNNNRGTDRSYALDIFIAESKNDSFISYVSDFMLGGGMYQWLYGDSSKNVRAEQAQYQNTSKTVTLTGLIEEADVEKALTLAKVHITGNIVESGGHGGGIASNGDVIIGKPSKTESQIVISKSWDDIENRFNTRPDKITVDIQYGDYTLRGIELTAGNSWTVTLENMPNAFLIQENPKIRILECDCGQYKVAAESVKAAAQNDTLAISFTNTYSPTIGDLTVSKTVSGAGADSAAEFSFTVKVSHKDFPFTGTHKYGDIVFTDGIASFQLKDGQSVTAIGLPAGTVYIVAETDAAKDGYTVVSTGEAGIISENKESIAAFINHKDATPTPTPTPAPTPPQTGDETPFGLYLALALLSFAGMGIAARICARRRYTGKHTNE
ncbi:MAG: DUF5979 domain-containing protein [Clostridiales bacterium]|nr:DUF5979 domain-containing protein [Clostridiales bacterium]MDO4350283.1 DUF5979 domain-containing protein [Eubacteriales bacterium]MDY4008403.1 DUF5979 domain-containing protein [Candidatus Limiplasma sp.]